MYAALQFAVLTAVAMWLYPRYRFADHFLSDLGATRTWSGEPNHAAAVVFAIAVATLGLAMVVFASAWRAYAFAHGRGRGIGIASQVTGTLSGLAFAGVAVTPIDLALDHHNALVVAAFGLLLVFVACTTLVWSRNGAPRGIVVAGVAYAVLLAGYFAAAGWAVATDPFGHRRVLIVGQKLVVYAALAYVVYLTLSIRITPRRRADPAP